MFPPNAKSKAWKVVGGTFPHNPNEGRVLRNHNTKIVNHEYCRGLTACAADPCAIGKDRFKNQLQTVPNCRRIIRGWSAPRRRVERRQQYKHHIEDACGVLTECGSQCGGSDSGTKTTTTIQASYRRRLRRADRAPLFCDDSWRAGIGNLVPG